MTFFGHSIRKICIFRMSATFIFCNSSALPLGHHFDCKSNSSPATPTDAVRHAANAAIAAIKIGTYYGCFTFSSLSPIERPSEGSGAMEHLRSGVPLIFEH